MNGEANGGSIEACRPSGLFRKNADGSFEETMTTMYTICSFYEKNEGKMATGEGKANARLIAAAPDLLEAAQSARAALSELLMTRDPVVYSDALRKLDSAIAKAEGK
jgi:hypothetical protein